MKPVTVQLQLHFFCLLFDHHSIMNIAVAAEELVGNRLYVRAVDKYVGSLSVHVLIHGSVPVIHKSLAEF